MGIDNYTDQEIAKAILRRNTYITKEYLYKKCYPLFKALYNKYETDSLEVKEFIHEIYVFLLTPSKTSKICPLQTYRAEGSLFTWLKLVGRTYCHTQFRKKSSIRIEQIDISDIFDSATPSVDIDMSRINRMDVERILELMPNKRYSKLIRLRYLEQKTNEETAAELGMTMDNYYNKHKLAKAQFMKIYNQEGLL